MAYIRVIQPDEAESPLKDIYNNLITQRGQLAEVHKIQSLNPESIVKHMDFYMTLLYGQSPLKRWQREMIAVVVSATNQCEYCQEHHGEALNKYWKNDARIITLREAFSSGKLFTLNDLNLEDRDKAFCLYAHHLTKNPSGINENEHIESLKQAGASDREILDAALITSYFNFVNRMVLGLGVHLEENKGAGYNY